METPMEVAMAQSIWSNRKTAQQSLRAAAEDLAGEIATLNPLEPAALLQKWKALFGTDPSPLLARIFMVRAIAYRLRVIPPFKKSKTALRAATWVLKLRRLSGSH